MALSTVVLAFAQIGMILPFTGVVGVDKVRLGSGRWRALRITVGRIVYVDSLNWTSLRSLVWAAQVYEITDDDCFRCFVTVRCRRCEYCFCIIVFVCYKALVLVVVLLNVVFRTGKTYDVLSR